MKNRKLQKLSKCLKRLKSNITEGDFRTILMVIAYVTKDASSDLYWLEASGRKFGETRGSKPKIEDFRFYRENFKELHKMITERLKLFAN